MAASARAWGGPVALGRVAKVDWSAPGAFVGADPYLAWLDETGPERHLSLDRYGGRLPLAVRGSAGALLALHEAGRALLPPVHERAVRHAAPEAVVQATVRATCSPEAITKLRALGVRFDLGLPQKIPSRDEPTPLRNARPLALAPARPAAGRELVIGIIDDGCAFAHAAFCELGADGAPRTRVDWLWDQGCTEDPVTDPWRVPVGFGYGREADASVLNLAIASAARDTTGRIDEDLAYSRLGLGLALPPRRASHGTAVMGLAAGATADDAASTARIVFVQLPRAAIDDTSAGWLSVHVMDALAYIFDKAGTRPVVVNLSFGGQAGPHDGSSILERAMDEMLLQPDRAIVLAAGNGREDACHAHCRIEPGGSVELPWSLQTDDPSDSFAELRALDDRGRPAPLDLTVSPFPGGAAETVPAGGVRVWRDGAEPVAAVFNLTSPEHADDDRYALVCVVPTSAAQAPAPAPNGPWVLTVRNPGAAAIEVDAYVERDDSPFGRVRLRQSRFRGEAVTTDGTLSSIASGRRTLVAGGYRASDASVAPYSAAGPTRGPAARAGIAFCAPCERSPVQPDLAALGPRNGLSAAMSGTSLAAPQLARAVAALLAASPVPLSSDAIRAGLVPRAGVRLRPPDETRSGGGAITSSTAAPDGS